jgi:hypothetical protein
MTGYEYRATPARARHAQEFIEEHGVSDKENDPLPTEESWKNTAHELRRKIAELSSPQAAERLAASMFDRRYAALGRTWDTCPEGPIKNWWRRDAMNAIAVLLNPPAQAQSIDTERTDR